MWLISSTAGSGVRKVGMPASMNRVRPSATSSSPIQQVTTGLSAFFSSSMIASATPVGLVIDCGVSITSTPSTFGPSSTACTALR